MTHQERQDLAADIGELQNLVNKKRCEWGGGHLEDRMDASDARLDLGCIAAILLATLERWQKTP